MRSTRWTRPFASPFRRTIADDKLSDPIDQRPVYPGWIYKWIKEKKIATYSPKDWHEIKVPNVWMAGKIFSGLCWDIREELKKEKGLSEQDASRDAAKLVLAAIRDCPAPISFQRIKKSILATDAAIYKDNNHFKLFMKPGGVFDRRGLGD